MKVRRIRIPRFTICIHDRLQILVGGDDGYYFPDSEISIFILLEGGERVIEK